MCVCVCVCVCVCIWKFFVFGEKIIVENNFACKIV